MVEPAKGRGPRTSALPPSRPAEQPQAPEPTPTTPADHIMARSAARPQAPTQKPTPSTPTATARRASAPFVALSPARLNEATERTLLRGADRPALLASYGQIDRTRAPVVLVHGLNGSPGEMRELAEALHDAGRQVFFLLYDDRDAGIPPVASAFAEQLRALRRVYPQALELDIVAHSMGGLVSRAALNTLQDPSWLGESAGPSAPRAGFPAVRLRSLDTPWDGGMDGPEIPIVTGLLHLIATFVLWLLELRTIMDVRANSAMFDRLYAPRLEGVDIQNIQATADDGVRALHDLSDLELNAVLLFVLHDVEPQDARARNLARSLAQDSRYPELRTRARQELSGAASAATTQRFIELYRRVMPQAEANHVSILAVNGDPGSAAARVVDELRAPAAPSA